MGLKRNLRPNSNPPHAALAPFVEDLRASDARRWIPHFDGLDGGDQARVLFLLEAPGPATEDSKLVSRDNDDRTAENFKKLLVEACLPREDTVLWNIVPWYVGNDTKSKIRAVTAKDIEDALPSLEALLGALKKLQVVVLVGRKAQHPQVRKFFNARSSIKVFECFHPSPRGLAGRPKNREQIGTVLREIAQHIRQ